MSWLSKALGFDAKRERRQAAEGTLDAAMQRYQDPNAGMDQLRTAVSSLYSSALPQFNAQLQGVRENAIRRGISTGDLGTRYEGDLASAFQQNLTNAVNGLVYDNYNQNQNRYLQLASGKYTAAADDEAAYKNMFGSLAGNAFKFFSR